MINQAIKKFDQTILNLITMKKIVCRSFKTTVIFSLISLFLISCRPENIVLNENIVLFSEFPKEDKIFFNNICEYKKGTAGMIELVDSVLIILNVNEGAQYFLSNYSLDSNQVFKEYLWAGKGPGEAIGARGIGINSNFLYRTDKTRFAFVSGGGTVTNNYIYMCYSGDLAKNRGAIYARHIYIYDWDGNPVRKLILDRQIEGLAVSENDSVIYAFDVNTGFLVQAKIN